MGDVDGDGLTVGFYLAGRAFGDFAQVGPAGKVVEVEADVVGFGQVVEVAGVEVEEVDGGHGTDRRHGFTGLLDQRSKP